MKHRVFFYLSVFLLLFGLILPIEMQNGFCLGDFLLNQLGLPAWFNEKTHTGLHLTVLYALAIFLLGLAGLKSFADQKIPTNRILILILISMPIVHSLVEFGREFAMGLYGDLRSIEYDLADSYCEVNQFGEVLTNQQDSEKLHCHIVLINHSGQNLSFRLKLPKGNLVRQDIDLNDEDNPYEIINAHSQALFEFEKKLPPKAGKFGYINQSAPPLVLFNDNQSITLKGY